MAISAAKLISSLQVTEVEEGQSNPSITGNLRPFVNVRDILAGSHFTTFSQIIGKQKSLDVIGCLLNYASEETRYVHSTLGDLCQHHLIKSLVM